MEKKVVQLYPAYRVIPSSVLHKHLLNERVPAVCQALGWGPREEDTTPSLSFLKQIDT